MHGFWTYLKAEFAVEVLSKILFSGKFPRVVAYFIALLFVWYLLVRFLTRTAFKIVGLFIPTRTIRTRMVLRRIGKAAKKYGDRIEGIRRNQGGLETCLVNGTYARNIQKVVFWISPSTQKLQVSVESGGAVFPLPFALIQQYCANMPIVMHQDYALDIFTHLRLNYL